jgi:pyruvate kinase
VVFTRRGFMADGLAALRSMRCPIFAFTNSPITYKQLRLRWGVEPWLITFDSEPENTIRCAISTLRRDGRAAKGDKLVFVSDMLVRERLIDTIQLRIAE